MKLTQEQREMLQNAADNLDAQIREDYSGRGAFGKTCFGFVTDKSGFNFGLALARELVENGSDGENLLEELTGAQSDSMGRNYIYYFPKIQWEGPAMTYKVEDKKLIITGTPDDDCESLEEALETMISNSELDWIAPDECKDLTDAPILGFRDQDGEATGERWAYMDYQAKDPLEELREKGEIVFVAPW